MLRLNGAHASFTGLYMPILRGWSAAAERLNVELTGIMSL